MIAAVSTPYTVPAGLMDALQVAVLVLVAVGATAVVLIRAHVRQVLALSVYGCCRPCCSSFSRRPT
jgi:hypothetical protein